MAQSKTARKAANEANKLFGTKPAKDPDGSARFYNPQYGKRDINRIIASISKQLKKDKVHLPFAADPAATALLYKMYRIAIRDNDGELEGYCPQCKTKHPIDIQYPCPIHNEVTMRIRIPSVELERNSITCGVKFFDKLFPNLQSVSGTVNVQGTMMTLTSAIAEVIIRYVPGEKREACLKEMDILIQKANDAGSG